jgi:hypothetical protein
MKAAQGPAERPFHPSLVQIIASKPVEKNFFVMRAPHEQRLGPARGSSRNVWHKQPIGHSILEMLQDRRLVPQELLFLAVFLRVSLSRFFSVISGMDGVTACGVSMMCRFLVMPTVVVLRRFSVVSGSVGMVFGSLPVMLSCFLRHSCPPCSAPSGEMK